MTLTDILIIYLTFGAPLGVYKYLQNRAMSRRRRILYSLSTFVFWVPAAVQIVYLYFRNAYSGDGFVSKQDLDVTEKRLAEISEALRLELIGFGGAAGVHDVRETIDRYVGLAAAARKDGGVTAVGWDFFTAAGRRKHDLAQRCLMRRNLRRLERHHTQASRDLVYLLEEASDRFEISRAVRIAIELASQLEDDYTVKQLRDLAVQRGEVWKSRQQDRPQTVTSVPQIAMTASLNND
jgi:hypothetical protein